MHVEKIDYQHKEWFRRSDDLCKSVLKGSSESKIAEYIQFLEEYARLHFRDEESLMVEHAYEGYEEQRRAHAHFVERIRELRTKVETEAVAVEFVVDVMLELHDWFERHITILDRKLGRFLQERISG